MLDSVIRGGTVVDGTGAPGAPGRRRHPRRPHRRDRQRSPTTRPRRSTPAGSSSRPASSTRTRTTTRSSSGTRPRRPSNLHGVTSMIAGNCGFTLAPVAPADADYLRRMMAKVEGMPLPALETGVPWSWRIVRRLPRRARRPRRAQRRVPRRPLRAAPQRDGRRQRRQRGDARAARRDDARCSHDSIAAGGLGFSTTLSFTHSDGDGKPVASRWASQRRGARAVPRGQRARGHDARVRHRRLPARLQRRRGRADGRDDARRPAPAQLERAHDRLARAAALPRPGRARASTRGRRAAPRSR